MLALKSHIVSFDNKIKVCVCLKGEEEMLISLSIKSACGFNFFFGLKGSKKNWFEVFNFRSHFELISSFKLKLRRENLV